MNFKRNQFEEKLGELNLSENEKNCYRRLNMELLRSRIVYDNKQLISLAQNIKPMVKIDVQEKKVVFCSLGKQFVRAVIADAPFHDNYLEYLMSGKAKMEHLKYRMVQLARFTCYFPSDNEKNINLTVETVLQQVPRSVALKQATCFEARFFSEVPAENYDRILQCHKASVALYAPDFTKPKMRRQAERELPSSDDKNKERKLRASFKKNTKNGKPGRIVPLRRRIH